MRVATTLVAAMSLLVAGCTNVQNTIDGVIPNQEKVYESSSSVPPLEIPPDLSSSTIDNTTKVPEVKPSSATLSDYNNTAARPIDTAVSGVLPSAPDVRVARDGNARWLIVNVTPEQMWPQARNFLVETGLLIEREDPATGIIDTDWAEARTRAPQGFVRSQLNRLYQAFYGPARRDKFRLRLERGSEPIAPKSISPIVAWKKSRARKTRRKIKKPALTTVMCGSDAAGPRTRGGDAQSDGRLSRSEPRESGAIGGIREPT